MDVPPKRGVDAVDGQLEPTLFSPVRERQDFAQRFTTFRMPLISHMRRPRRYQEEEKSLHPAVLQSSWRMVCGAAGCRAAVTVIVPDQQVRTPTNEYTSVDGLTKARPHTASSKAKIGGLHVQDA